MWLFLLLLPFPLFAEISALYLSWYGDPATTMTIQWHTPEKEYGDTIYLKGLGDEWDLQNGEHARIDELLIHKVSLSSLQPDTEYLFRIGEDPKVYRFRTAPLTLNEPLRFIVGGDLYQNIKRFRRMSQTVLDHYPSFVVLGGDIAYALTIYPFRSSEMRRWLSFFKAWKESMIYEDGTIVPFLIVPGTHDITPDQHELFFTFFAFPEKKLYRTVQFGNYLTLYLLDTGHFHPIEGRQTVWLENALYNTIDSPYRFAIYHEAGYPSNEPYHGIIPKRIRKNWSPLFEKYKLTAAFEHHNRAYKRTHPIKANQIHPDGVIYLGDGGWGAPPRKSRDLWYLANRKRKSSVLLVELTREDAKILALDFLNNQLDMISLYPPKQ